MPCSFNWACLPAAFKSLATISSQIFCAVVSGAHPEAPWLLQEHPAKSQPP